MLKFRPKTKTVKATDGVVLCLQVPRTNDKKELAAEQLFASLHGLLTGAKSSYLQAAQRQSISFEIAVREKRIGFYVWVPETIKSFVEEQIYAQYPSVHITEVPDFSRLNEQAFTTTLTAELQLTGNEALPIKTFQSFEVDPLAAITAALAKFESNEEAWLQLILRPAPDNWNKRSEKYIAGMRQGGSTPKLLSVLMPASTDKTQPKPTLTDYQQSRVRAAEEKSQKISYEACMRIVYRGNVSVQQAKLRMQAIVASYKQFNTTYLNGFTQKLISQSADSLSLYQERAFSHKGFIFNIEEIASLYHLPHTSVETPFILWAATQTAEPPANLPIFTPGANQQDISPVAVTNFRGHNTVFGLPRNDRSRHLYIIGQTGTGKSGLLELLTISDIYSPYGFAVVDPHGDYALNTLKRIPPERAKDVVYFNPADTDFPIAFNPMEVYDPKLKTHTCSELIGVLKRMFESWGPRLEYILRYSILALLDYPEATMLDITRILTDKKFRTEVLKYVEDPVVRNFWTIEFASWNDKFAAEAVAPVLNKVGAFTANPMVRNIIGQPKGSFNIRQIMDERKILIVNLSRGLIGEDNAALLGALMVTKIQMAAMSRANIEQHERTPFYLYVDEFQNFATDSFATILSEARKYGLTLTVANQYISQMMPQIRDAVFGNVGSIIAFRTSADDAGTMQRYFEPKFTDHDLVHMHNRHFVVSMTIEGEKAQAFSATSLNLPDHRADQTEFIIAHSRQQYAIDRAQVEAYVGGRYASDARPDADKPKPAVVAPAEMEQPVPAAAQSSELAPKPKKRQRHHRKKTTSTRPEQDTQKLSSDDTTIYLR